MRVCRLEVSGTPLSLPSPAHSVSSCAVEGLYPNPSRVRPRVSLYCVHALMHTLSPLVLSKHTTITRSESRIARAPSTLAHRWFALLSVVSNELPVPFPRGSRHTCSIPQNLSHVRRIESTHESQSQRHPIGRDCSRTIRTPNLSYTRVSRSAASSDTTAREPFAPRTSPHES